MQTYGRHGNRDVLSGAQWIQMFPALLSAAGFCRFPPQTQASRLLFSACFLLIISWGVFLAAIRPRLCSHAHLCAASKRSSGADDWP